MSSPERKTKKKPWVKQSPLRGETTQEWTPLPDDLVVSCLARVSRLHYPYLSLVSKSFRSLLASPELYETRSALGRTESCLYVCLSFGDETNPRWFTLCQKPDHLLTKKKSSGYALATIPIPHSPPAHCSGLVAVGSNIYNIGGSSTFREPSSSVSILDVRSHTWREAPSMLTERSYPDANVFDGKIYVTGGCEECNNSNWMEVFDTKTQTLELVSSDGPEICGEIYESACIDEKLYMLGTHGGLAYKPREGQWEKVGCEMDLCERRFCYAVINNVLYSYNSVFTWYDTEARVWRNLKGSTELPMFASHRYVKMADFGGKMVVLWDRYLPCSEYKKKRIWCAVVALERRNSEEIWGKVQWVDVVLTVPASYAFLSALVATV